MIIEQLNDVIVQNSTTAVQSNARANNPWHTGTPTEEGDYLVKLDVDHHEYPFYVLKWYKGGWYSAFDMNYPACPQHSVLKWQKIKEDFEASTSEEGREE